MKNVPDLAIDQSDTQWLIASDLDGTLLDHFSYSHQPADATLQQLESQGVPVILNSSKTRHEILELREALHNHHPFIVENGSAIFIPRDYFPCKPEMARDDDGYWILEPGAPRQCILKFLRKDSEQHGTPYLSFSAATNQEIVAATGLSSAEAEKACQRDYSEPLQWRGDEQQKLAFIARANAAGFSTLQGGRFLHILGQTDKGLATRLLKKTYQHYSDRDCKLIASGDGPNDLDMLKVADIAIVVRSPTHAPPSLPHHPKLITTRETGPQGWAEAIREIFSTPFH
ncbi:HAD-IIB family hydrolase [Microbulbifer sp. CAU 1566]|uniref:HAD-IIB family hydrolase n=1 Tax=Microbulbifer sp. CAU 1566 TaxID=2933269 RepID=UPI002005C1B7|nr:HAD-IIB family hydrolase [Microbulbifer sp. CAU 1566]MCK7595763.1 HAD-IIB family hydrolase [Microbulbifer sp. CAU 1566]